MDFDYRVKNKTYWFLRGVESIVNKKERFRFACYPYG